MVLGVKLGPSAAVSVWLFGGAGLARGFTQWFD